MYDFKVENPEVLLSFQRIMPSFEAKNVSLKSFQNSILLPKNVCLPLRELAMPPSKI